ncbi:hypothetical protein [Megasphaera elsdenii]|uniref:hypothetical protein n=1 Tax=Megasphaera elsdenii TaxID=907 RepID=UPI0036F3AAB9
MAIVVVLAILFSCILLILCLPITYALTVHIGTPFQVEGQGSWGRKLADASWSYSLGEELHHELHTCWKRSPAVKEPVETPPPTPEEAKKAWEELEKESQHLTYEDLLREKGPEAPESTESGSPQKKPPICQLLPGIFNSDFLAAFFTWLSRLLGHGQIRRFTLTGIIGLPEPHETGMLAGALYAICPGSVTDLQFNFVEEQYDCTVRASGRLYPAVLLLFTAVFAASRPVRRLWAEWHAVNKEEEHG